MMKLVFATTNSHKLDEVRAMLPDLEIVHLNSIDFTEEVEETGYLCGWSIAQMTQSAWDGPYR